MLNGRMKPMVVCLTWLGLFPTTVGIQDPNELRWVMRRAVDFPELPQAIREHLERQQCTIPQSPEFTTPHNVVWGEFARRGQRDVAVLCALGEAAKVLVFWGGNSGAVDSVPINHGYRRGSWIRKATPRYIEEHVRAYGRIDEDMPERVDHDGVEDGIQCCSIVYYRHLGRWLRAPGAD